MDKTTGSTIMKTYSYLALGDSYTIGEQVLLSESFPYQAVQVLRQKDFSCYTPEIIATTGHTTDELNAAIDNTKLLASYDFVSLLIGVNNQYRGRTVDDFEKEVEGLLQRAIQFAGNISNHVFVLSIPDWGITPFAAERDTQKIAEEIDAYNLACKNIAAKYGTHFIDITTAQRLDGGKEGFLATDKLHPSGKEYAKWATLLAEKIISTL
jgi:lysophospholipase L1-like esterase